MSRALVIVESPAKAETIAGYLGDGFVVKSSIGHIRDLATKKQLSEELQQESWAYLGVNTENDFEPHYVVSEDSEATVRDLKKALKGVSELYLATDEDREGEAIAWHLLEVLDPGPKISVKRMVFHEITEKAILDAISKCRDMDKDLVQAQETRRILDRLYGFDLSQLVQKSGAGSSAGRVQSPTTRLLVERERERMAFVGVNYWDLTVDVETVKSERFSTRLISVDGKRGAVGKDFGDDGSLKNDDLIVLDEVEARDLAQELMGKSFVVENVDSKPYRRRPPAPFTTSTFQQAAGQTLGLSSRLAMGAAQMLYQKGYITYMRTDSTTLSDTAIRASRKSIVESFGSSYLPDKSRHYENKVRNAQEAHEAIRPSGDQFKSPEEVARLLDNKLVSVYELIWQRTLASQMTDVEGETTRLQFTGLVRREGFDEDQVVKLGVSGTVITHMGFRLAFTEADATSEIEKKNVSNEDDSSSSFLELPGLQVDDCVTVTHTDPKDHTTKPPSRYTEASLVKKMEELGIGRPSTYATIISRILDNEYAWKKGRALYATVKAFLNTQILEEHFPRLVDYEFTATMEDDLDVISNGEENSITWLKNFYWGSQDDIGLHNKVQERADEIDPRKIRLYLGDTSDGKSVYARHKKTPYVQCEDDTSNIPPDLPLDELTPDKALTYINTPSDRQLGNHPEIGDPIFVKQGTFGPYVSLGQFPKWPKASTREGLLLKLPHHLKVLKVAAAYLRTIVRSSDDAAVLRIINSPSRGVGKASLEKSVDFAKEKKMNLLEAFGHATDLGIKGTALTGINEFLDLHKIFVDRISDKPDEVLRTVLEKSGYWAELEASKNSETQIEVLEAFLVVAAHYETVAELVKELDHQEDLKQQPKPKTASLFDTMTFEHVTLEDALQLLSLPRVVGEDNGIEVTVQNGPYGPYVKKGGETRSLRNEEELFTISFEDCLTLLSQPKKFGRAAKPPLADFGLDPVSNNSILLREGRFGPYVTDGVHNASLQLGDEINELSFDRVVELLAEARLKGPKKKPKSKRK